MKEPEWVSHADRVARLDRERREKFERWFNGAASSFYMLNTATGRLFERIEPLLPANYVFYENSGVQVRDIETGVVRRVDWTYLKALTPLEVIAHSAQS